MEPADVQFLDATTSVHDMENVEQLLAIAGMLADEGGSGLDKKSSDKVTEASTEQPETPTTEQKSSQPKKENPRRKKVTCDLCPGKVFAHRKSLRWHQRTVHMNPDEAMEKCCRYCNKTFKRHLDKELHEMRCTWAQNEMNPSSGPQLDSTNPQLDSSNPQTNPSVPPMVELSDPQMNSTGPVVSQTKRKKKTCKHCGKEYKSSGALYGHIRVVHEGKRVTCSVCGVTMKWQCSLIPHMLQVHNIKIDGKKPLVSTCDKCGKIFPSRVKLREHLRQVHNQRGYRFKCKICTKTYSLTCHLLSHPELVKHQCSVCRMRFRVVRTYEKHIKQFNHKQTQQAMNLTDMSCYQCKRQFTDYVNLHHHIQVDMCVMREEGLECRICRKCFPDRTALQLHRDSTHFKLYKRGKNAGKLKVNSDLPAGKQQCNICGKLFSFQYNLTYHYNWHKGINYKCDICHYESPWRAGIREHKKHHQGAPSTMFYCKVCKAPFDSNVMRIYHQFTHNEVPKPACKCGREFKSAFAMMSHARKCEEMESEEIAGNSEENEYEFKVIREYGNTQSTKYYVCTYCGEEFRHKRWCDAHEKSHAGADSYKCSACGFQCSEVSSYFIDHLTSCETRKNMASTQEKYEEAELILDYRSERSKGTFTCSVCAKVFKYKRWWRDCEAAHKVAGEGKNKQRPYSAKRGRPSQHGKREMPVDRLPATVDSNVIPATVDRTPATIDRNVLTLMSSNPELFNKRDDDKRKRKMPVYRLPTVHSNAKRLKSNSPETLDSFLKKPNLRCGANTGKEKSPADLLSKTPSRYYYIHEDSDSHGGSKHSGKSNAVTYKIKVRHIYKCGVCNREYRSKITADNCENAHLFQIDSHHCSGCERDFNSPKTFANHLMQCQMWREAEPSSAKKDEQSFLKFHLFNLQLAEYNGESSSAGVGPKCSGTKWGKRKTDGKFYEYCDFDGVPGLFSSDSEFSSESSDEEDWNPDAWAKGDNHVDITSLIHPNSRRLLQTNRDAKGRFKRIQNERSDAVQMKAQRELETSAKLAPNGEVSEEEEEDIIDLANIVSVRFDPNGTTQDEPVRLSVKMEGDSVNGGTETDHSTQDVGKDNFSENNAEVRQGFFDDIVSISFENGLAKDDTASVKIEKESMNGHDVEKGSFTPEGSRDSFSPSPTNEEDRGFFDDIEIV